MSNTKQHLMIVFRMLHVPIWVKDMEKITTTTNNKNDFGKWHNGGVHNWTVMMALIHQPNAINNAFLNNNKPSL